jgi:hypothetical protein
MKDAEVNNIDNAPGTPHSPALVFQTYLRQRFNFITYGALAIYLFLYAKADLHFQPADAMSLIVVLLFLLVMRLYDDLQNARYDQGKPDRIYTEFGPAKKLYIFFIVITLLVSCVLLFLDPASGTFFLMFLLINHGIYVLLVNQSNWRYFLPFLKYSFIAALISKGVSGAALSLFFAFLTFDILDDPAFPLPRWSAIISSILAIGLLLPAQDKTHYIAFGGLAGAAIALTLVRHRYSSYLFLVLFLILRLIDPLYEI